MAASAGEVIAVAKTQIGLKGATRYGGRPGDAWCAYFVYWCARQAGVDKSVVPCLPWCNDLRDFYREQGRWRLRDERKPAVGDIICFGWASRGTHILHVGFVSAVDEKYVYTIEGNSGPSRCVREWKYPLDSPYIMGYCRPHYTKKTTTSSTEQTITETHIAVLEERPSAVEILPGTVKTTAPRPNRLQITITAGEHTFTPRVLAGVRLSQTRAGAPATLTFEVLPGGESFYEGSRVTASVGDTPLFFGYVFTKSRDMDGVIRVTAYDQLRYFKNKDFYHYANKSATDLLKMLCRDYGLCAGIVEESGIVIPERIEDYKTLFDLMEYALTYTEQMSGKRFVLYDDAGKLCLRAAWESGVLLTQSEIRAFSYSTSIDGMYNRVKAIWEEGGVRTVTLVQDQTSIGRYGVLQTVEKQNEQTPNQARALLQSKNRISRRLRVTANGDVRVRAGCEVELDATLGDTVYQGKIGVYAVTHVWDGSDHTMELVLEGGEFDA